MKTKIIYELDKTKDEDLEYANLLDAMIVATNIAKAISVPQLEKTPENTPINPCESIDDLTPFIIAEPKELIGILAPILPNSLIYLYISKNSNITPITTNNEVT